MNLTQDTAGVLVHFSNGDTQQWLLTRLNDPTAVRGSSHFGREPSDLMYDQFVEPSDGLRHDTGTASPSDRDAS